MASLHCSEVQARLVIIDTAVMRTIKVCTAVPAKYHLLDLPGRASHAENLHGKMTTASHSPLQPQHAGHPLEPLRKTQCREMQQILGSPIRSCVLPHLLFVSPRGCL